MVAGMPELDGPVQLMSLWVDPCARGTGVANGLVQALLRWAGPARVWLAVHGDNDRAIAVFRRLGFQQFGVDEEGCLVIQRI